MENRGKPTDAPRTPFGERLLLARSKAGLTQKQVADALGLDQSTYADWERYSVTFKPEQITKLAEILDVSYEYLFQENT